MLKNLCIIGLILCVCLFIRNIYTFNKQTEAANLVYKYVINLSENDYDFHLNYFEEMIISYPKYLFSLDLWGKYSAIKPEYKNIIQ
jgi:hypothetical protein